MMRKEPEENPQRMQDNDEHGVSPSKYLLID
jgi:hypothetical protein